MSVRVAAAPLPVAAALLWCLLLAIAGCVGDPGALPSKGGDAAEAGSTVEADAGTLPDPGELPPDESSSLTDRGPAPGGDDGGEEPVDPGEPDVPPPDCETDPGAFGCPCKSGDDCNSGFCVPASAGGTICTTSCIDRCPGGWRCTLLQIGGQDPTYMCLERSINLCRPCHTSQDCRAGGLGQPGDRCVTFGDEEGSFCGIECSEDADCPTGFTCEELPDASTGQPAEQCVPEDRACTCNPRAIDEGAATTCSRGACPGQRVCTEEGLTDCDAPAIGAETCDGTDDDCDGETDEEGAAGCKDYYRDADGDGAGALGKPSRCLCTPDPDAQYTAIVGGDCDDGDGKISPDAVEDCNGIDDDCDGVTDKRSELVGEACDGPDDDLCKNGTWSCREDGLDVECASETVSDILESCNGADDDCDGSVDEDFPQLGATCDGPDDDLCRNGTFVCAEDGAKVTCNEPPRSDTVERCNDIDDDCDGTTDEGFVGLGETCDGDDTDLCKNGVTRCSGDGLSVECADDIPANIEERCNKQDDDCDGLTDEDFSALGVDCDGPDSDKCAHGTTVCTSDGLGTICGPERVTDLKEACNHRDDDCDEEIDEDFPELGLDCDGPDSDDCRNGTVVCTEDGLGTECSESSSSWIERCNSRDDDCDGQTDEGFLGLGQACDGSDADLCPNGVKRCTADGTAVFCDEDPQANVRETCNGRDDDCDDEIDEGFPDLGEPCDGPDSDRCKNGNKQCSADGEGTVCAEDLPADIEETCNGEDDDCDNETDEDFSDLGASCDGPDADSCKNGRMVCSADERGTVCQEDPSTNVVERCNAFDDDCDGHIDEDFAELGEPCDSGDIDDCAYGQVACADNGLGTECRGDEPSNIKELCNSKDDDCDNQTDEGFPGLGEECDSDDIDLCKNGTLQCSDDGQGTVCAADLPGNITELCNGVDDDCDNQTDEGFPGLGDPCDSGDSDQCKNGTLRCAASGLSTECGDDLPANIAERCNGTDDDCDGATDEAPAEGCSYYYPDGDGDGFGLGTESSCLCAPEGRFKVDKAGDCDDDVKDVHPGATELCNYRNDDCDGDTDEGFAGLGDKCDSEDSDKCENGTLRCSADGLSVLCSGDEPANIVESCNGADDDCDGQTDEGFATVGEACDSDDSDLCRNGKWVCSADGSSVVCADDLPADLVELCNGEDDDCDGQTDEDFTELGQPCDGDDADECKDGHYYCAGVALACDDDSASVAELCSGKDEDCDGETDEDFADKGEACDGDDLDKCESGTWTCKADQSGLECANETDNFAEQCGGGDEDCDGQTDEEDAMHCAQYNRDKDGDTWGSRIHPQRCLCDPDPATYYTVSKGGDCDDDDAQINPTRTERCNSKDDNCNGETDEDFPLLGKACYEGDTSDGFCRRWACRNDGIELQCTGTAPPDMYEILFNPGFDEGDTSWSSQSAVQVIVNEGHPMLFGRPFHDPDTPEWLAILGSYSNIVPYAQWLEQTVTLPQSMVRLELSYAYLIDTDESSSTQVADTLQIQIRDAADNTVVIVKTYSNRDAFVGLTELLEWRHETVDLTLTGQTYPGLPIKLFFFTHTDDSASTHFLLDSVSLKYGVCE